VAGFKYFSQFKQFNELSEVLLNQVPARKSDTERILSYNIGLGLHDVYFANKIYERLSC
jgi:ornithine cyclodeaminase